ncbi:hypothetical protein HAX54_052124 [Datura stramonium]|uniref:Uncharacterized protein n=1 Tax=Datura stramonium TaxID=4076 RepID=A0ABS8RRH2_DATST|nr:hypothetical protein [Datura stramonium]
MFKTKKRLDKELARSEASKKFLDYGTSKYQTVYYSRDQSNYLSESQSIQPYVMGFCLVKRPSSFNFHGAWLYNYGVGIHLLENKAMEDYDAINEPRLINPKDNQYSSSVLTLWW